MNAGVAALQAQPVSGIPLHMVISAMRGVEGYNRANGCSRRSGRALIGGYPPVSNAGTCCSSAHDAGVGDECGT